MFVLSSLVADIKSIVIGAVSHTAAIKIITIRSVETEKKTVTQLKLT